MDVLSFRVQVEWTLQLWRLVGETTALPAKPLPEHHEDDMEGYQEALEEWNQMYHRVNRSQNVMKGLVVFAGLSIIVSSISLSVKGCVNVYIARRSSGDFTCQKTDGLGAFKRQRRQLATIPARWIRNRYNCQRLTSKGIDLINAKYQQPSRTLKRYWMPSTTFARP
jgi:hypothetical protein